ncbi:hypothetical protein HMPREF9244_00877 [Alloscardovia omnicolens F0580]|uniref:Uncharacterized protein n=1 Tax=Alloscardovia omnicolens F0580 TaxID=1321816 RepID=U1RBH0_9BIFI|nr:hypothetical protein HMPREF9244_00877 [Alloscardovia omnicolens F0580]
MRREVLCGVLAADVCVLHYVHTTYMCGMLGTGAWRMAELLLGCTCCRTAHVAKLRS